MENFANVFLLLALICFATAIILTVSLYCCYVIKSNYSKKRVIYIKRTNGKTRITKDRNGNVIKVEDIRKNPKK